jgi:hypothetical protein
MTNRRGEKSSDPQPRLWLDEIRDALTSIGGQGTLADIYAAIERRHIMDLSSPHWKAAVRRTIEQHSSMCEGFTGLPLDDVFCAPRGKGSGFWAIRESDHQQAGITESNVPAAVAAEALSQTTTSAAPCIFVCHSHQDNKFTARLVADLRAAGSCVQGWTFSPSYGSVQQLEGPKQRRFHPPNRAVWRHLGR